MTDQYVAVNALSIPRFGDDGKPTTRNDLIKGGETIPAHLLTNKHDEFVGRALERGSLKKVEAPAEPTAEETKGSEVNGPGTETLNTAPTRPDSDAVATAAAAKVNRGESGDGPKRPGKNASLEDLRSYATVAGVEFEEKDTKADLNRKFDEKETADKRDVSAADLDK